nr:carbohydrate binding family 9 domain-containing protein [Pyrinomonadaceae bacterium]
MKHSIPLTLLVLLTFAPALAQPAPSSNVSAPPAVQALTPANGNATNSAPAAETTAAPAPAKSSIALPPEKAQPVRIPRFSAAPVIDGQLDEEVWKQAVVLKDFYQINPGDNIAPTAPTELLIGYDDRHLYLGWRAYDDPAKVRATVARRDNVFGEDNVRVLLDTFNDQRKAYILGFNPLGVQQDGILTEGGGQDFNVDLVMESKGQLTSDGYIVEVAIPFKSLRYEAGKGKVWGFHAWRNIDRNSDELDSWMPISRDISGTLNQAGQITGLEGISTERTIELIPSLTVSETGRRVRSLPPAPQDDIGRLINEPIKFDPGLTAKFGISPTMTLDLAINPDFAQVEADQLVVTTNQRFPIFFPEKRPFFLEGIEIFRTPSAVVHTRAIVDPDIAVKLTGRRGPNTYGVMLASDNGPGNFTENERTLAFNAETTRNPLTTPPGNIRFLDKNAHIGVFRLNRNIGRENTLGFIATTYNFIEKHNHLAGLDGRFKLDPQTTLTFQLVGTHSRNFFFDPFFIPGAAEFAADRARGLVRGQNRYGTGNGMNYNAALFRSGRNWNFELFGEGRTRNYRADVGFTSRTNTNFNGVFTGYNSDPQPKGKVVRKHFHNFTYIAYDFQGRTQSWESEFNTEWGFQKNSFIGLAYEYGYERLIEEEFGPVRNLARCPTNSDGTRRDTFGNLCGTFAGDSSERSTSKNHYFLYGGIRPSKKHSINGRFVYRDGHFDLDFGAGRRFPRVSPAALLNPNAPLDPGPGGLVEFRGSYLFQPTNSLSTSLDYTKQRLRRYDTDRVAFDVNLISWRTTYQFTRFLFARGRIDYETLPRRARGQFLLGYTPNPGTAFF